WVARGPGPAAEAARVGEADYGAARDHEVDVVVRERRLAARHDAQTAGHAEVHERGAARGVQQQILAAPLDAIDGRAGEALRERAGHRPAQPALAHDHALDAVPGEYGLDAAARGLDLG